MAPPVFDDEALGKAFDARLTRRSLAFVKPYWKYVPLALVLMLMTSAADVIGPYLTGVVAIDEGISRGNSRVLMFAAFGYVGIYVIYWLTQNAQSRLVSHIANHVVYDIRHTLFAHIQHLSLDFFDKREVGRIIARLTSDVGALNQMLTAGSLTLVIDSAKLFVIAFVMMKLDYRLAMLTFTVLPPIMVVMVVFRTKARVVYRNVRRTTATVTASVAENVTGVKAVKSFSREKENLKRFERVNTESQQATMQAVKLSSILWPVIMILSSTGMCIILWSGGMQVKTGLLTVGVVWTFIGYMQRFFQPIQTISQFYYTMQGAMAGAERIFEFLDTEPSVKDKPDAIDLPTIEGVVEFRNVTFGYGGEPILKDVSFIARPGQTIALVGPTGAGKTTITSLVARQYDIQDGRILIDGLDIRDVTMRSLRRQMGIVLQDSFLFPGSVKENIRYGRLEATDQEVEAAARALGAHEFIAGLPQGYKTEIHEGASNIATGQKQLLSFVRALLADPRILILDEATSSIDTYTEMVIQEALRKLLRGRTSFVVAHRLSTIAEADRILVIQDGRIAESGTHTELLEKDGLYRKLYDVQFSFLESDEEVATEA